ncbi:MAG: hypothetical protein JO317_07235, partial [Verrucomicrobiae bacterium]|nr:hypothetical protein [Verrucomicrobiae bacterium]
MPRWFTRRSRDLLTVSALAAAFAAPARLTADLIYSPSRQFTAQSASVSLAGQAAVHADQIRDNFYSFLGLRINPGRPVQIELF